MQLLLECEDVVRGKDCLTIPTDLQVVLHVSSVNFFLVYIYGYDLFICFMVTLLSEMQISEVNKISLSQHRSEIQSVSISEPSRKPKT